MDRRQNFQTVAFFFDIYRRGTLELSPSYQRRSVWNQSFKDYFIDTVLMNFPAPAIFLYEEISETGAALYNVVDGKQRLTTLFEFIEGVFPVSQDARRSALRGKYFAELPSADKKKFFGYQFSVEYLPSSDESIITEVFDRINRNTAKLTAQELRHARLGGEFIKKCDHLASWMFSELPPKFPRITSASMRQMKDVELVSTLLLLVEEGPKGYSQAALDQEFADRDEEWAEAEEVESTFRATVGHLKRLANASEAGGGVTKTRLRNQADFYSLFGAMSRLDEVADYERLASALAEFVGRVESEVDRAADPDANEYYEAARSASNDAGPRKRRIELLRKVIAKASD